MYATPDVDSTVAHLEKLLGVRAAAGGQHLGHGTRNALLSLGPATYLEIIGPDPAQPDPPRPRFFGIDDLDEPRLVAWVGKADDLDGRVMRARKKGVELGEVRAGSRKKPDGTEVAWRATDAHATIADGIVPFFIAWTPESPHPATTSPTGCTLIALRAEHPDVEKTRRALDAVGVSLPVTAGERAALIATLETPYGPVELR